MFKIIEPPTEKIRILCSILKILMVLNFIHALFLAISHQIQSASYFMSGIIYLISWGQLSYFGCCINQLFNVVIIWVLLLQSANKLQNGLYEIYLSPQGIYKMSILIVSIVSTYFNFNGYQQFKQISLQIVQYENVEQQD